MQARKIVDPVSDISEVSTDQTGEVLIDSTVHQVLSNEEISRYSRQLILPEIGVKGDKFCITLFIISWVKGINV